MTAATHASCYHVGYSLTCTEYDTLLTRAQGRCELCGELPSRLQIDHDHRLGTWAVRGLLCQACNNRLGHIDSGRWLADSPVRAYLKSAWHLAVDTTARAARVKPRGTCPTCGRDCAVTAREMVLGHWSRLPGMHDTRCAGGRAHDARSTIDPADRS